MNGKDFICDLKCPIPFTQHLCCRNCKVAREGFLNKGNEKYWTDKGGFWGENGCRLPRDEMPEECRKYDCKEYTFTVKKIWARGGWFETFVKQERGYK